MTPSRHIEAIRAALLDLVNDATVTDQARLRTLLKIDGEITGFILDLKARLPEPPSRRGDPPRI
jgi:hypothetical protein